MLLLYISGQWLLYQSSHPESTIEVIRPTTLATVNDDNANIYIYIYTLHIQHMQQIQRHKYANTHSTSSQIFKESIFFFTTNVMLASICFFLDLKHLYLKVKT